MSGRLLDEAEKSDALIALLGASLTKAEAQRDRLRAALEKVRPALDRAVRGVCRHEERHRGGVIWTICDGCGAKWADDEGGFKPNKNAAIYDAALEALKETE